MPVALPIVLAWGGVLLPIFALVVWFIFRKRQIAKAYPEEHAFRALAKRMHLRTREIKAVRRFAREQGSCAPIGVLMNEQLLTQALHSNA